jgi:hypothetical protein
MLPLRVAFLSKFNKIMPLVFCYLAAKQAIAAKSKKPLARCSY